MFDWKWDFTFEILPRLLLATTNTLLAAGIGYTIALVVGLAPPTSTPRVDCTSPSWRRRVWWAADRPTCALWIQGRPIPPGKPPTTSPKRRDVSCLWYGRLRARALYSRWKTRASRCARWPSWSVKLGPN